MGAIAVIAAGLAAMSAGRPTGIGGVDEGMRMAFAVGATLAASKARPWTWLVVAGGGAAVVTGAEWRVLAYGSLALAFYGAVLAPSRNRVVGAAVGAAAAQGLLRADDFGPHGATAAIAGLAVLPLFVSAYRRLRSAGKSYARRLALVALGLVVLAGAGAAFAVLSGRPAMNEAIDKTQRGLDAARQGQQEQAGRSWDDATRAFTSATDAFDAPWAQPARLVPILSQHVQTISAVSSAGRDISRSAGVAARVAPYRDLRSNDGQVNVALLRSMREPVDDAAASLRRAEAAIDGLDREWLTPPLAAPLHEFDDKLAEARPEAELASQALAVAPGLLGADGVRHYFIAFGTPSESRFLGGFIGAYGELTAANGKLTLSRSGKIGDLNQPNGAERTLSGPRPYLERYGRFFPTRFMQNVSASPDFPTVARVIGELYPQATAQPVDGSIYVDPYALAAFLQFTGPITVEGVAEPLTAANAADFLLKGQYERFPDTDERNDYLGGVSKTTFEALTKANLPGPTKLAETLGPVVEQRRLLFSVREGPEQDFLRRIGLTGEFPSRTDNDFFALKTANANPNKIDSFLTRDLTYDATFNPTTGEVVSTATVRLTNAAPSSGLPDYVIGNRDTDAATTDEARAATPDRPPGTNTMYLSLYTPLLAHHASSNGAELPLEVQDEFGLHVYSTYVSVPAGQTIELTFNLSGTVRAGGGYRLGVSSQPTVNPDHLAATIRTADGSRITAPGRATSPAAHEDLALVRDVTFDYAVGGG